MNMEKAKKTITTPGLKTRPEDLIITNCSIEREGKKIISNFNLTIKSGEITVIMGPNGAGKSTILSAITGHPAYTTTGSIKLGTTEITTLTPDKRSIEGIFLSFQHPSEIAGVKIGHYLRTITNIHREHHKLPPINVLDFQKVLEEKFKLLNLPPVMLKRSLNHGLSGGEKKRLEIVQLLLCEPKIALLDETDSGLDVDGIKNVSDAIKKLQRATPNMGILLVTHNPSFLKYLSTSKVIILKDGKIVHQGDQKSIKRIEEQGFTTFT